MKLCPGSLKSNLKGLYEDFRSDYADFFISFICGHRQDHQLMQRDIQIYLVK